MESALPSFPLIDLPTVWHTVCSTLVLFDMNRGKADWKPRLHHNSFIANRSSLEQGRLQSEFLVSKGKGGGINLLFGLFVHVPALHPWVVVHMSTKVAFVGTEAAQRHPAPSTEKPWAGLYLWIVKNPFPLP